MVEVSSQRAVSPRDDAPGATTAVVAESSKIVTQLKAETPDLKSESDGPSKDTCSENV